MFKPGDRVDVISMGPATIVCFIPDVPYVTVELDKPLPAIGHCSINKTLRLVTVNCLIPILGYTDDIC